MNHACHWALQLYWRAHGGKAQSKIHNRHWIGITAILCFRVHAATARVLTADDGASQIGGGRWLVVDDTGGLVVAALAEKMGILYPADQEDESESEAEANGEKPDPVVATDQPKITQDNDVQMQDAAPADSPYLPHRTVRSGFQDYPSPSFEVGGYPMTRQLAWHSVRGCRSWMHLKLDGII